MSAPVTATWSIELNCDCPKCDNFVDLLDYPDFWEGRHQMLVGEHDTERTRDMEVLCPECGHEFTVDCKY